MAVTDTLDFPPQAGTQAGRLGGTIARLRATNMVRYSLIMCSTHCAARPSSCRPHKGSSRQQTKSKNRGLRGTDPAECS